MKIEKLINVLSENRFRLVIWEWWSTTQVTSIKMRENVSIFVGIAWFTVWNQRKTRINKTSFCRTASVKQISFVIVNTIMKKNCSKTLYCVITFNRRVYFEFLMVLKLNIFSSVNCLKSTIVQLKILGPIQQIWVLDQILKRSIAKNLPKQIFHSNSHVIVVLFSFKSKASLCWILLNKYFSVKIFVIVSTHLWW